jgi:NAD(P)H-hydrate epimerase
MLVKTSDSQTIKPFLKDFFVPRLDSHKGQNGKVLIIGGSSLFHSASLWAAEIASHFVDMVHYSSTQENNKIFLSLKKKFRNGIVVPKEHLLDYVEEDDVVLMGPGMVRNERFKNYELRITNYKDIISIEDEGEYTAALTKYLIENFPEKRFVFDAGALQMMDPNWLLTLKTPAILTPHQKEFEKLFNCKEKIATEMAQKYHCVILLKAIDDIISDGEKTIIIHGGNQGLTKGGTGDLLAGLCAALYSKNEPLLSAVFSSYLIKKASEELSKSMGYWYGISDLIHVIPQVLRAQFDRT